MEKSRICLLAGLMWTNANIGVMLDWACGGSAADGGEMDMGGFWAEVSASVARCGVGWLQLLGRQRAACWSDAVSPSTGCLAAGSCWWWLAVDAKWGWQDRWLKEASGGRCRRSRVMQMGFSWGLGKMEDGGRMLFGSTLGLNGRSWIWPKKTLSVLTVGSHGRWTDRGCKIVVLWPDLNLRY
ncbi:hypothetical protein ACLOJK_019325 [Asimina triloba]